MEEEREPIRGTWVMIDGELVPKPNVKKKVVDAPFVRKDEVDPFMNHATGKIETSMSTYRRNLKDAGYFEKGNDRMKYEAPTREERMAEVRECVEESKRQIKWGMAPMTDRERERWNK